MIAIRTVGTAMGLTILAAGISAFLVGSALAHCDSTKGPVIPEAKAALEKGDVTPMLKWITEEDEAAVKAAFSRAVAVRAKGPDAKELADHYFVETLVRLHRAGEGAPYTGIKGGPVEPIVAMADQALARSSAEEMIRKVSGHMAEAIRGKLEKVVEARKSKDESVTAGRAFVEAYVTYMHYVEGIHAAIKSAGAHHAEAGEGRAEHRD